MTYEHTKINENTNGLVMLYYFVFLYKFVLS